MHCCAYATTTVVSSAVWYYAALRSSHGRVSRAFLRSACLLLDASVNAEDIVDNSMSSHVKLLLLRLLSSFEFRSFKRPTAQHGFFVQRSRQLGELVHWPRLCCAAFQIPIVLSALPGPSPGQGLGKQFSVGGRGRSLTVTTLFINSL